MGNVFKPFSELTDCCPFAQRLAAHRGNGPETTSVATGKFLFGGRTFSPISFVLLGLMIAIVLWGTSYKLSLYCPHPAQSSRTQVAKLWIAPRSTSIASIRGLKGKLSRAVGSQAFIASNQPLLNLDQAATLPSGRCDQGVLNSPCLIPPRSPPSFYLCLG